MALPRFGGQFAKTLLAATLAASPNRRFVPAHNF